MMQAVAQGPTDPDADQEQYIDDDHEVGIHPSAVLPRGGGENAYSTVANHHPDHPLTFSNGHHRPSRHFCVRLLLVTNGALLATVVALLAIILSGNDDSSNTALSQTNTTSNDPTTQEDSLKNLVTWKDLPDSSTTLQTVAFGSCSSQHMPLPYWDTLVSSPYSTASPDLVLLMGDNVYGDCTNASSDPCWPLFQAYRDLAAHASVQGAAQQLSVYPTLDDHDYGMQNADTTNGHKHQAIQYFRDFFDITDLPLQGVYRSRVWGPPGQRLQVILLDTRFDKAAPRRENVSDSNSKMTIDRMLSETQWEWLNDQLTKVPAELRIVVSSVQVLNDGTRFECWRHAPSERARLYHLIRGKSVILVSGDRHVGGFYRWNQENDNESNTTPTGNDTAPSGDLYEVTASSWTHTIPFGAYSNCTSAATCDEADPRRRGDFIRVNHFGWLDIDWTKKTVRAQLRQAASSEGVPYILQKESSSTKSSHNQNTDAGQILREETWSFPF